VAIQKLFFENGIPKFISAQVKKDFIEYAKAQKKGEGGGPGTKAADLKTDAKLARLMGVANTSIERAKRYFRDIGELPKYQDYPDLTKLYVERFMPEAQNADGSFNADKFRKLSHSKKQTVKSNRRTLEKVLADPTTEVRANELKKFVDEYRKLKAQGKEYRLFLGSNFDKKWITPTTEETATRSGPRRKTLDTLKELWKGGDTLNKNPKNASSLQMFEGFNSPLNKAYLKDLKEIKNKYLEVKGLSDYSIKNKDGLYKQYMDEVYKEELPEFYKSKEFKNADNINEILRVLRKRFSDPVLYPGSDKGGSFDLFERKTKTDHRNYRKRTLTDSGKRKLVGGKLYHQPTSDKVYAEVVANYLKTPKGKDAIKVLDDYVELNKEFSRLKPTDVDSWEKYNRLAAKVRDLKYNAPKLDIFLKPLTQLGLTKVYEEGREVPIEEVALRRETTSTRPTIEGLEKYYKENKIPNPIKPSVVNFFLKKGFERAGSQKYEAAYNAGLNKILQGTRFKNPTAYREAVRNLNKVLTLQLGGLGVTGEHRVGVKMLDYLDKPDYVARMVLSSDRFNKLKGQEIEKALTPIMNNPRYTAAAKKAAAEREYGKFFKRYGLTPEMQKTYPKFEVAGDVLKETQLEKAVGKFGLGKTMGDLKGTVKNILTEQALADKVLQAEGRYKPFTDAKLAGWTQKGRMGEMGVQNTEKVKQILNILTKQGVGSSKADQLISELVEGEFAEAVNKESMAQFGRKFCKDGCLATTVDKDPGLVKRVLNKMASTLPRLGTVGKIGTVAAGTGLALSGLRYNSEKGEIVSTNTDQKADQNQILQYVKDNPLKVTAGTSIGFAAQEVPGAYKAARDLGRGRVRSTLGISGALRPILTTFGTPLMTGLYEGTIGAKRLEDGETMTDILTDPLGPALGVSLMEPLSKMSGVVRGAKPVGILGGLKRAFNPFDMSNVGTARPGLTSKILRMGMSPRVIAGISRLGPYGMLAGAGLSALDQYNKYQNKEGMIYNLFND